MRLGSPGPGVFVIGRGYLCFLDDIHRQIAGVLGADSERAACSGESSRAILHSVHTAIGFVGEPQ